MTTDIKQLPLWQWILLFIGAIIMSFIGYAALVGGSELSQMMGYPGLTIVCAAIVLGMYALLVKLLEQRWPTNLPLRKAIPHWYWS